VIWAKKPVSKTRRVASNDHPEGFFKTVFEFKKMCIDLPLGIQQLTLFISTS